jgi:hypothetical protein
MSGVLKLFNVVTNVSSSLKSILPAIFATFMLLVQVLVALVESFKTLNIAPLIKAIASSIAAADYNIYLQTQQIITNPQFFGLYNIAIMLSSLWILYILVKKIGQGISFALSNSSIKGGLGTTILSVIFLAVVEVVSIKVVFGQWVYPGIGIITLIVNLPTVVNSISNTFTTYKDFLYNNI